MAMSMYTEAQHKQWSQLVARSWVDESFKKALLSEPAATLRSAGIDVPAGITVQAAENTDKVLNLLLPPKPTGEGSQEIIDNVAAGPRILDKPTMSNYMYPIPGCGKAIAKAWTDASFKSELLSNPAAALKGQGVAVPAGTAVHFVENSDKVFHLVLPAKPTGELSDEHLDVVSGGALNAYMTNPIAKSGPGNVAFGCASACCCCCVCCC